MISAPVRNTVRIAFETLDRVSSKLAAELAEKVFCTPWKTKPPVGAEAKFLAEGRRTTVPFKGAELACWSWGEGPAVLLVHGWSERSGMWSALAGTLVEHGYRVIAFDAPAHGASTAMTGGLRPMLTELADAVRAVLAREGDVEAVVAHSFGASSAALALGLGATVKSLVLFAPVCDMILVNQEFGKAVGIPERIMANVRANMRVRYHESAAKYGPDWPSWSVRAHGPRLTQRVLVVHDRRDKMVPFSQGQAVAASTGGELHETRGLGHTRVCSDAATIDYTLAFIDGCRARASVKTRRAA